MTDLRREATEARERAARALEEAQRAYFQACSAAARLLSTSELISELTYCNPARPPGEIGSFTEAARYQAALGRLLHNLQEKETNR